MPLSPKSIAEPSFARWLRWAPCLLLVTMSAACHSATDAPMTSLPTPPAASAYTGSGDTTTAAQLAMTDLHARLREHFDKPWDIKRYDLPASADWDGVLAHYAQELGTGWTVDERYAESAGAGYRSRVWLCEGKAFAIAVSAGRGGEPAQVLTVFTPEAAR